MLFQDDEGFEAWVLESLEPPEDPQDWEPSEDGDPPDPNELPEYLLDEPRSRVESPRSWGSQEFVHPTDWESSQEPEPPEDWEVAPPLPELTPEDFEHPDEWDLPDDSELIADWRYYGLRSTAPLTILKSHLTRTAPLNTGTFPSMPSSRLTAGDWTPLWLPWISKLVSRKVRRANIATLFKELLGAPDVLKIIQRETALSWVPASTKRGFYYSKDPNTGVIERRTLLSPQTVHRQHYDHQEAYQNQCRKFMARGKPLVEDIISCFDDLPLFEKVRRAIALRVELGMPTRVPVSQDVEGRIETLEYVFGKDIQVDVNTFFKHLKVNRARVPRRLEDDDFCRPQPGMSDADLIEYWLG